jgi:autotransporter-associated beta strand protein
LESGSLTVGGTTTITDFTNGRYSIIDVTGGTFTSNDTTGAGIKIGGFDSATSDELYVNGGTVNADTVTLGDSSQTAGTDVLHVNAGALYLGSGGIVNGGDTGATNTITLSGGILGAQSNWSSSMNMAVTSGSTATIQTANASGTAYNIGLSGVVSGAGTLTATGSGTLTLSGANTYTGGTTISGGTLLANGTTSTGTGAVSVAGGAVLGGTGTINTSGITSGNAITVASGGTLSQTAASGGLGTSTLTLALQTGTTVNLNSGAKLAFDLGASGVSDQINITGGTLTLNSQNFSSFTFTTLSTFTGSGTYDLIVTAGSSDLVINSALGTLTGMIDSDAATLSLAADAAGTQPGSQFLVLTIGAPEPSTLALLLGSLGLLAFWRLRTRRSAV